MSFTRAQLEPPAVDMRRLLAYRLERIRAQMRGADVALCVLVSPVSGRYAIDIREYPLFQSRIPDWAVFVPVEGPVVLHGGTGRHYVNVDDYRPIFRFNVFGGGLELSDRAREFANLARAFLAEIGLRDERRVALEMLSPSVTQAMLQCGLEPCDAEPLMELAKLVKSADEIACMRHAIEVADLAMERMYETLEPGIRENELWSILHQVNVAHDGDWTDGRMLASGPRTNPWLQEATGRVIANGELVAFDTDMVGPFGYCADISRTWVCGDAKPTAKQLEVYRRAHDEVVHNLSLVRAGVTYKELSDGALAHPDEFIARRYPCLAHGIGMSDEYPKIYYREDWPSDGYDGVIEPDTALCVESFVGSERGGEGVKLEQMVLVTDSGCELLSSYPLEERLLVG